MLIAVPAVAVASGINVKVFVPDSLGQPAFEAIILIVTLPAVKSAALGV